MQIHRILTRTTLYPGSTRALIFTVSILLLSGCVRTESATPGSVGNVPQHMFDNLNQHDSSAPNTAEHSNSAAEHGVSANGFPIGAIRIGMAEAEVEQLLGCGEPSKAPEGYGLPRGMWADLDGETKFIACTYRKWGRDGKSYVIAFLDGHVTGMFDGSPAVVEE